jgi:hypothetical protein
MQAAANVSDSVLMHEVSPIVALQHSTLHRGKSFKRIIFLWAARIVPVRRVPR